MSTNSILNIFGYQTQPTTPETKEMFLNLYNNLDPETLKKIDGCVYNYSGKNKFDILICTEKYKKFINTNFDDLNFNSSLVNFATAITGDKNPNELILTFADMVRQVKRESDNLVLIQNNNRFILDNNLIELTTKVITNNNQLKIKSIWRKSSSKSDIISPVEGKVFKLSIADIDEGDNKPVFFVNNSTKKCYYINYVDQIYLVKKDDLKWYNNDIKLELIRKLDKEALCKEIENKALTKYIRPVVLEELFEELSTHTKLEIVEEIAEYRDNIKSLNKKINEMPEELYEGATKTFYFDLKTKITNILELELLKN